MAVQTQTSGIWRASQRAWPETRQMMKGLNECNVARGLGWFSIGLGLAELLAPQQLARLIGTGKHNFLYRSYGAREIGAGVGILTQRRPTFWVWSRVAGDAVDIASLGAALASRPKRWEKDERGKTAAALAAVAGVTALDIWCASQLSKRDGAGGSRAEANLIVNRSPEECYRFWRNLENLPRFMNHLESVRTMDDKRSHWVALGPGNKKIEWDAEIVNDVPNRRISWRSLPGADVPNSGSVDFQPAPGNRGTIIRVQIDYRHGGYQLGAALAKLIGRAPEQMAYKDLRRFKQVIETGDVVTTEGQPAGRNSGSTWLDSIAR